MKLYYSAGSCSTSCHISLEESGLKYEAIEIDWDNESDPNIAVVEKLNPMGTLPILVTNDGKQLDQNLAIHTYIADLAPTKNLLPAVGTFERAQTMNWLSFITSDLHKSFSPLFALKAISDDNKVQAIVRDHFVGKVNHCLKYLDNRLSKNSYLSGNNFTVADAYAFVVIGWSKWLEIPLTSYKNVESYLTRIAERPAVMKVLKAEGLV